MLGGLNFLQGWFCPLRFVVTPCWLKHPPLSPLPPFFYFPTDRAICIGWNTTHYFLSGRKCFSIIPVLPYHLLLLRLFLELNFFTPFMGKARGSLYLFNSSCLQLQGLQATGGISWWLYMCNCQSSQQHGFIFVIVVICLFVRLS